MVRLSRKREIKGRKNRKRIVITKKKGMVIINDVIRIGT